MSNKNGNFQQQNEANTQSILGSEEPKYGYWVDDIEGTSEKYKCIYCFLIIRDPIQLTECGHRCCSECIQFRMKSNSEDNISCPVKDCNEVTKKTQFMLDKAFKKELDMIVVKCRYRIESNCNWIGSLVEYQKHLDEFHIQYSCYMCKITFVSQALLDDHLKTCSEMFEECRLGTICTTDMIPKVDFLNHLCSRKHQESIMKYLTGEYQISSPSAQQEDNQRYKEWASSIIVKLESLSSDLERLQSESTKLDDSFRNTYQQYLNILQEMTNLQTSANERQPIKQQIQPTQEKLQRDVEQIHQLCDDTQCIYKDGTLTWRIDNVSAKLADAQAERQTSIYSPTFYSSPTGYCMRVRLFLFGDGNARRTHISIFFMLMKGEYDSILKWPFPYKVTFCLLDQTGQNSHIIDSFYPDVKSSSFQRPKENANIASGIPKFCPLPMLLQDDNAFVRDDTMFIRILIAMNETPKSLLPYMLTLNPALPTHVQDVLISQEAVKQQSITTSSS